MYANKIYSILNLVYTNQTLVKHTKLMTSLKKPKPQPCENVYLKLPQS